MATERLSPKHPDWIWLQSPADMLMAERSAPYDPKIDCWIADPDEVYIRGKISSRDGDKITVEAASGTHTLPKAEVFDCNPPKFEKEEDMSNLSILNKACVLHNLRTRYKVLQIYTYSGLFCICINPYKWLMVYTPIMRAHYRNRRRTDAPPHLYAVADGALQLLEMESKNQSSLITGESGAGKTENTKKVLQYYALNCADPKAAKSKADKAGTMGSLEEQIVQANPPLEAYGNAKTVRNNNSSRFGKFIRIHFGPTSKIAAADIETYLLEKSRITFQLEIERNYHIFYQIMTDAYPKYWSMCNLGDKPFPGDYFFINQGVLTVDKMDDAAEMRATDEAFDILGFDQGQKDGLYKGTIAICFLGNQKWKQKGREEQAEPDGMEFVTKASQLLEIETDWFVDTFMKPKLKVGKDFVKKGQNLDQVSFAVSATSKSLFARMFDWIVLLVNESLDTPNPRKNFIGVLDIAGFEIFELNVLEQLLINYTNEKLQQFFNHHMFVEEQEEYKREGIQWNFVDFGMDLVVTIELIEKKMGILLMLEEECIVPKATDKTYLEKMMGKHLGKHKSFGKPKPAKKGKPEAHFEIHHYAGTVGYNVTGWLFKNKDPVNEAVIGMMGAAGNPVVSLVFQEKDTGEKKKGASMMTISAAHRESLSKLMTNLHSTHPHFVRCIIPNEIKKSGHTDAPLVMHQLNCNGVLEGIRICMLGLPNKVPHADFMTRYSIVAPKIFADLAGNPRECAQKALVVAGMDPDSFRCGTTKIMFRAGMLSTLEEIREGALSKIFIKMQCQARRVLVHVTYQGKIAEKKGISSIQRNIRLYYNCRDWAWYKFYTMIKGEIGVLKKKQAEEERRKQMAEGLAKFQAILAQAALEREAAQAINDDARAKIAAIKAEMEFLGEYAGTQAEEIKAAEKAAEGAAASFASFTAAVDNERSNLKATIANTKANLTKTKDETGKELAAAKAKYEASTGGYQKLKTKAIALEADKTAMKGNITVIADAIAALDKKAAAALVEKREMWSTISAVKFTTNNHSAFLRL
jgi:myosin heavy subunit